MRTTFLCLVGTVVLGTGLSAQLRTLPPGYEARPGEYSTGNGVSYPFSSAAFRYQEVHTGWKGTVQPPLTSIGFRRAPRRVANVTAVAHTNDAMVTMGPGSYAGFTNNFANNYTGTAVVTMAQRQIKMPDWTQPNVPDHLFTAWFPLDAPYMVDTTQDFIWELLYVNSTLPSASSALYYSDRTSTTSAAAFQIGTGCVATGRTSAMTLTTSFTNNGTTMGITFGGSNFPSNAAGVLHIGLSNPNLSFPTLCGMVYATPIVALPIGPASATGSVTSSSITFPYKAALLHPTFYTQAAAPDVGQTGLPIVVSNGRQGGMPPGSTFKYTYTATTTSATGSGPFTAGSVITAYQ